jgi:PHP family Zn ribbon phosphoesterase
VIALKENGELEDCIARKSKAESIPYSITKRVKERLRKEAEIKMEKSWERFTYQKLITLIN